MADDATFVRDLIVCGEDGKNYLVPEKVWKKDEIPDNLEGTVEFMIKHGIVLAAVPTEVGIGSACYLINLASIKARPEDD